MTAQPAPYAKTIVYDAETRDFAMYLDGELVGFAATYPEAERRLDALVYDLLARPVAQPAPAPVPSAPASTIDLDVLEEELRVMEPATFRAFCQALGQTWRWRPYASTLRREGWTVAMVDAAWQWIAAADADVAALHALADSGAFDADNGFDPLLEDDPWYGVGNDGSAGLWVHWGGAAPAPAPMREADVARYALANGEPEPTPPAAEIKAAARREKALANARAKAAYHLAGGLALRQDTDGAWLVPSATTDGRIYRVADGVCDCRAGEEGRPCWHCAAVERVQRGGEHVEVDTVAQAA